MDAVQEAKVELIPYTVRDGIRRIERIHTLKLELGRFQEQMLEIELEDSTKLHLKFLDLIAAAGFVLKRENVEITAKWKLMPPGLRSGRTPANDKS